MLSENLANVVKTLVQEILRVMMRHPLRENCAATAHDSSNSFRNQRQILHQHTSVDSHIIHALLSLFLDYFKHYISVEVFNPLNARNCFIDGHRTNRDRRMAQDGFTYLMYIAPGREIHHRIGTIMHRCVQLV